MGFDTKQNINAWGRCCNQDIFQQVKNCSFNKLIDIMETRSGYTKNLQSVNSQLCGLFCIYIAHYFYNAINFIIPNVNNELELINFVKHMMS